MIFQLFEIDGYNELNLRESDITGFIQLIV